MASAVYETEISDDETIAFLKKTSSIRDENGVIPWLFPSQERTLNFCNLKSVEAIHGTTNLVDCLIIYSGTSWYDLRKRFHGNSILIGVHRKITYQGGMEYIQLPVPCCTRSSQDEEKMYRWDKEIGRSCSRLQTLLRLERWTNLFGLC